MTGAGGVMISVITDADSRRRRFSRTNDDADADAATGRASVFRRRRSQTRDERLVFIADGIHFILDAGAASHGVAHSPFPFRSSASTSSSSTSSTSSSMR